jgi:uncharacterized protein (DUF1015 family)
MPKALPFRALRPALGAMEKTSCLPYDVMGVKEAKEMAEGNPLSFLRVIRPEIGFPDGYDPYAPEVYEKARETLAGFVEQGVFALDEEPAYILYEESIEGRSQAGIACLCDIEDYLSGAIKRHENTMPEKEQDRIRHFKACRAQTEPLFFVVRSNARLSQIIAKIRATEPDASFCDSFGVENRVWSIREGIGEIEGALESSGDFYIADGHHRAASSSKAGSTRLMAVVFPDDEVSILGYHRLVSSIAPHSEKSFLEALTENFEVREAESAAPSKKGEIGIALKSGSFLISPKAGTYAEKDPIESLDCSIVQRNVFSAILGILDPTQDSRLSFVGGSKGAPYLEGQVKEGPSALAVALWPVSMEEIMHAADKGEIMPPKSTWFEPKLRSGLFAYPYADFANNN